jgi:hypothetical protein
MKRFIYSLILLFLYSGFSPDDWTTLMFMGTACCSSELNPGDPWEGEIGPYTPRNLYDNNPATAWVEGVKGYGSGQYFIADLGYRLPGKIEIRNGYQKSKSLFEKNSRVKNAKITLLAGFHMPGDVTEIAEAYTVKQIGAENVVTLRDMMGLQEISLPVDKKTAYKERVDLTKEFKIDFRERLDDLSEYDTPMQLHYFLKFEIVDVYPGSAYDDTCISDIFFHDMTIDPLSSDEIIKKVYESDDEDFILFDTDIRTGIILVDMKELDDYKEKAEGVKMAIVLMDTSPDKEWAQVDFMFTGVGARVEEIPVLYHVRSMKRVGTDILDYSVAMYGFTEEDGKIWLNTNKGLIDLEKIKNSLTAESE